MMGALQSTDHTTNFYTRYIAHLTNKIQQNVHLINIKLHPFLAFMFVTVGMLFYHDAIGAKDALDTFQEKRKDLIDSTTAVMPYAFHCLTGMPRPLSLPIVFYLLLAGVLDLDRLVLQ